MTNNKKRAVKFGAVAGGLTLGYFMAIKMPFVIVASIGVGALALGAGYAAGFATDLAHDIQAESKN